MLPLQLSVSPFTQCGTHQIAQVHVDALPVVGERPVHLCGVAVLVVLPHQTRRHLLLGTNGTETALVTLKYREARHTLLNKTEVSQAKRT